MFGGGRCPFHAFEALFGSAIVRNVTTRRCLGVGCGTGVGMNDENDRGLGRCLTYRYFVVPADCGCRGGRSICALPDAIGVTYCICGKAKFARSTMFADKRMLFNSAVFSVSGYGVEVTRSAVRPDCSFGRHGGGSALVPKRMCGFFVRFISGCNSTDEKCGLSGGSGCVGGVIGSNSRYAVVAFG